MFPDKFEDFLRQSLSEQQCEALTAALDKEPETSVRYNPYKISARPQGDPVPCMTGKTKDTERIK